MNKRILTILFIATAVVSCFSACGDYSGRLDYSAMEGNLGVLLQFADIPDDADCVLAGNDGAIQILVPDGMTVMDGGSVSAPNRYVQLSSTDNITEHDYEMVISDTQNKEGDLNSIQSWLTPYSIETIFIDKQIVMIPSKAGKNFVFIAKTDKTRQIGSDVGLIFQAIPGKDTYIMIKVNLFATAQDYTPQQLFDRYAVSTADKYAKQR